MAMKYYQGRVPGQASVAWRCPTCGAENTTPIEQGCKGCGTGADAKHVGVPVRSYADVPQTVGRPITIATDHAVAAAQAWQDAHMGASLEEAFMAGVLWAQSGGRVADAHDANGLGKVDKDTIAAALRFYAENMLALGAIPGQLTAEDARQLADTFDGGLDESAE